MQKILGLVLWQKKNYNYLAESIGYSWRGRIELVVLLIQNKILKRSNCKKKHCLRNPSLSADNRWTDDYWPMHTPLKRETLLLNADKTEIMEGNRVKKCAFWRKFLPQLGKKHGFEALKHGFETLNMVSRP